jgi:Kef-type K+ transport system membrane component KefB
MHYLNEQDIFIFLLLIFTLLLVAKGLGEIFRRDNQPTITAEILFGVLLGPTLLVRFFPEIHSFLFPQDPIQQNMLKTVAWLGILFFLLKNRYGTFFSMK